MRGEIILRFNDSFIWKPYFQCGWYRGPNFYFGWLWLRVNFNVWRVWK